MKPLSGILACAVILLSPQLVRAQGMMTYLSNLGQPSDGSLAVGSDSWLAAGFQTGTNHGGYVLNSVQLGMTDATDNPSGFTVTLYRRFIGGLDIRGPSLGTLDGSLNPTTAGIYTFTPASSLTLSPNLQYLIVLTAGTAVADGAYNWSFVNGSSDTSYNPSGNWNIAGKFSSSVGGFSWNSISGDYPQFAINVTDVPEPDVLGLFGLGGLLFLWHRRKSKTV